MTFHQTFSGFVQAHIPNVCHAAGDLMRLVESENVELLTDGPMSDGSLPPRKLAIWFVTNAVASVSSRVLDAVFHWFSYKSNGIPLASTIRATVLGSTDSCKFLRYVGVELSDASPLTIVMRWKDQTQLRVCAESLEHVPSSLDSACFSIQSLVVRMIGIYGAPIVPGLMRTVPVTPQDAYLRVVADTNDTFHAMLRDEPSLTLGGAAALDGAGPLEATGIAVRIVRRGESLTSSDAFHGVLLCLGHAKSKVCEFAVRNRPLNAPKNKEEFDFGLHTLATHTRIHPMRSSVSLFSPIGVAGKPIQSFGSCIYVNCTAIRPIDDALVRDFEIHPCSAKSVFPTIKTGLVAAARVHMQQTEKIIATLSVNSSRCTILCTDSKTTATKTCLGGSESIEFTDPSQPSDKFQIANVSELASLKDVDESARFILGSIRVSLLSERTTISEAYIALHEGGAPKIVLDVLAEAGGRIGLASSVSSVLTLCANAIRTSNKASTEEPIHILANAAVDALVSVKKRRFERDGSPLTPDAHVKRLLGVLGLKRASQASLRRGHAPKNDMGITKVIIGDASAPSYFTAHGDRALREALDRDCGEEEWQHGIESAMAVAIGTIALGKKQVWFLICSSGTGVRIFEINVTQLVSTSIDHILTIKDPVVFLLRFPVNEYKAILTATAT
jgi:hypothetical protein